MAKVSPGEFFRQVRAEGGIMVIIMTSILAIFFFGVDAMFSAVVQFLLGLLAK